MASNTAAGAVRSARLLAIRVWPDSVPNGSAASWSKLDGWKWSQQMCSRLRSWRSVSELTDARIGKQQDGSYARMKLIICCVCSGLRCANGKYGSSSGVSEASEGLGNVLGV